MEKETDEPDRSFVPPGTPTPRMAHRRSRDSPVPSSRSHERKRSSTDIPHLDSDSDSCSSSSSRGANKHAGGRPPGSFIGQRKKQRLEKAQHASRVRWSSDSDAPNVAVSTQSERSDGSESDEGSIYEPQDSDASDSSASDESDTEETVQLPEFEEDLSQKMSQVSVSQPSTSPDSDRTPPPTASPTASVKKVGSLSSDGRTLNRHTKPEPTKKAANMGIWPHEVLTRQLQNFKCDCATTLAMNLSVSQTSTKTLGKPFRISCNLCDKFQLVSGSGQQNQSEEEECCDLLKQVILTSILHGLDYSQVNPMMLSMGLPPISKATFTRIRASFLDPISDAAEKVLEQNVARCKKAAEEAGIQPDSNGNYRVPGIVDGTWKTPGFQSRHGVVVVSCQFTGLPLDFVVLSKDCDVCKANPRKNRRKPHACTRNHPGSSGSMEKAGAKMLWERSIEKNSLIFEWYLGDGDSKAFGTVENSYDRNPVVKKIECRNHYLKRLVAAIYAYRKAYAIAYKALKKNKVKQEGPNANGMKKNLEAHMQHYLMCIRFAMADSYIEPKFSGGSAEEAELEAAENLLQGIIRATKHMCSDHSSCQPGLDSYCVAQRVLAGGSGTVKEYWPRSYLPCLLEAIQTPTKIEMMRRVVYGLTQNQNESANSIIWLTASKKKHHGAKRVKMAAALGMIRFSEGTIGFCSVFAASQVPMSSGLVDWYDSVDTRRVRESVERKATQAESRRWRRHETAAELAADLADDSYQAGCGN